MCVMRSVIYFFCTSLQSGRRLYQMCFVHLIQKWVKSRSGKSVDFLLLLFVCLENKGFVRKNMCCAICIVEKIWQNFWLTPNAKWYIFMLSFLKQIWFRYKSMIIRILIICVQSKYCFADSVNIRMNRNSDSIKWFVKKN